MTERTYIKKVFFRNLRTHKETEMEFHPGVNIVMGTSDSGKSSFIKNLDWIINNTPKNFKMKSWFASKDEDSEGTIEMSNGRMVTRIRGSDINAYILDGDENNMYEAMNGEVPDKVFEALQLNGDNITKQISQYFLLNDKGSSVAKLLNSKLNLSIIDEAIQHSEDRVKKLTAHIKSTKNEILSLQEKLVKFKNLEKIQSLIGEIDKRNAILEGLLKKKQNIEALLLTIKEKKEAIEGYAFIEPLSAKVEMILTKIQNSKNLRTKINSLEFSIYSVQTKLQAIKKHSAVIEREKQALQIEDKILRARELKQKINVLTSLVHLIISKKVEINKHSAVLKLESSILNIESKISENSKLKQRSYDISKIIETIQEKKKLIERHLALIRFNEQRFLEMTDGKECPLLDGKECPFNR